MPNIKNFDKALLIVNYLFKRKDRVARENELERAMKGKMAKSTLFEKLKKLIPKYVEKIERGHKDVSYRLSLTYPYPGSLDEKRVRERQSKDIEETRDHIDVLDNLTKLGIAIKKGVETSIDIHNEASLEKEFAMRQDRHRVFKDHVESLLWNCFFGNPDMWKSLDDAKNQAFTIHIKVDLTKVPEFNDIFKEFKRLARENEKIPLNYRAWYPYTAPAILDLQNERFYDTFDATVKDLKTGKTRPFLPDSTDFLEVKPIFLSEYRYEQLGYPDIVEKTDNMLKQIAINEQFDMIKKQELKSHNKKE